MNKPQNTDSQNIENRYEFCLLFDVKDGNPNGDPDADNRPRIDPETGHGLVSDVCIKRKIRNYVQLSRGPEGGFAIYIKDRAVLARTKEGAYQALGLDAIEASPEDAGEPVDDMPPEEEAPPAAATEKPADKAARGKAAKPKKAPRKESDHAKIDQARDWMMATYWDVRTFGAVMSSKGADCGQTRGPVQVTMARSVEPVNVLEHSITRIAVETQEEADKSGGRNHTMGRKSTVAYGLYRLHGFISPALAASTGFKRPDLELLWEAIWRMFEHDRSASRGFMASQDLVIFEHDTPLGNAPSHKVLGALKLTRKDNPGPGVGAKPARDFSDYVVELGEMPPGVRAFRSKSY
jgi:CRISPR-associated protein Csd2